MKSLPVNILLQESDVLMIPEGLVALVTLCLVDSMN